MAGRSIGHNTAIDNKRANPSMTLQKKYVSVFRLQLIYGLLCIVWNAYGLWLSYSDAPPVGPTASWGVVIGAPVILVLLFICLVRGLEAVFALLSTAVGLLAASRVYAALSGSAEQWNSVAWQLLGGGINVIGALSAMLMVYVYLNSQTVNVDRS